MKNFLIASLFFSFALTITLFSSSCDRKSSILTVGYPDSSDFKDFDTFNFPTERYFFYGKIEGDNKMWQNQMRSKWDTATKVVDPTEPDNDKWSEWLDYEENIYVNVPQTEELFECGPDSNSTFMEARTYFSRPNNPFERLEIYFYDCINLEDTNDLNYPNNTLGLFQLGANPFSSPEYGRNGVKVVYIDDNLDRWETEDGSGQLEDTYFRVTDSYMNDTIVYNTDTMALWIVEGEFAGRLYNKERVRTVLDAKFRVRLIPRDEFLPPLP